MPTYSDAFERFRDTDIAVFDPETFTRTNLTDDGVDGQPHETFTGPRSSTSRRWVDDDTIAFIRYEIPAGGHQRAKRTRT